MSRRCIRPGRAPKADGWTLDAFLKAAEACHKAGFPFGIGLGTTADNVDTAGAIFHSFGAVLVDKDTKITVKSDPVRQALDYYKRLDAVPAAGCAGMGRCLQQQVAGRGQGRADHEPAERLGGRQARCAAGGGAVLDARHAGGPEGPLRAVPALLLAIWSFGKNKSAAKSLLLHLSTRAAAEKMVAASGGYDMPSFDKLTDFKTWAEEGAAEGHALPLSQTAQPSDPVGGGGAGTAQDRRADLRAGAA